MILAVVGSGNLGGVKRALDTLRPESVLTGKFWGTDAIVREWAMDNGVTVITLDPNLIKHGTSAMRVRNEQIVMVADEMLMAGETIDSLQAANLMGNAGKMVWLSTSFKAVENA